MLRRQAMNRAHKGRARLFRDLLRAITWRADGKRVQA